MSAIRPSLTGESLRLGRFDALVRDHEKRILMIAYQICGNLEDARDIAQDTFLKAFRYRHRFQAGRRLAAWLNRIAVNAAIDFLKRREKPGVAVPIEEAWKGSRGAAPAAPVASPERSLAARQEAARLLQLLDLLAPRERVAFVLRYLQGQPTAEVARAMGCTRITVRRHSLRAREKLRRALARSPRREPGSRSSEKKMKISLNDSAA